MERLIILRNKINLNQIEMRIYGMFWICDVNLKIKLFTLKRVGLFCQNV